MAFGPLQFNFLVTSLRIHIHILEEKAPVFNITKCNKMMSSIPTTRNLLKWLEPDTLNEPLIWSIAFITTIIKSVSVILNSTCIQNVFN